MGLTVNELKALSCKDGQKQTKFFDGNGLYLLVKNTGSKLWRFRYKYAGKHKEMALGKYPSIPLKTARDLAGEARLLLINGTDPMESRLKNKKALKSPDKLFYKISLDWWDSQRVELAWSDDYTTKVSRLISNDLKVLHKHPIENIDVHQIISVLKTVAAAGSPKKASLIKSILDRVFKYALANGIDLSNPIIHIDLKNMGLKVTPVKSFAAITDKGKLAKLIEDIDSNQSGDFCTVEALKLIPKIFLRPNEIRYLEWNFVDFDDRLIRIPASNMKSNRDHLVPMAKQVISQLQYIKTMTGYSKYVFPSQTNGSNPISKNVLTNSLRRLGYPADIMSAHGFRATASTTLNEQHWDENAIEVQLAHLIGTKTSQAYNRSKLLAVRKKMMQAWADFLDSLKS
jgi:integrase